MLCQHTVKNFYRMIKKKVLLKTRDDIEREGMRIVASIDENDTTNIPLPVLFEISIKVYNLIKNYPDFYQNSRLDELVELIFQRYRSILKVKSIFIYLFHIFILPSIQIISRKIPKPKI